MRIPDKYIFISESVEDLVRWCYPDILNLLFQYMLLEGPFLPNKLYAVDHIHNLALSLIQREIFIFEFADSIKSEVQAGTFAVEYLNSTSASGLSPHILSLKEGGPVILFRNSLFCSWPDLCCFNSTQILRTRQVYRVSWVLY